MTEAAPDHTDSKHSVDELFQLLVRVRDIPPATAKKQILEFLQLDKLQINCHIRGGARKTRPVRQATEEELHTQARTGATLDHLYEVAPPEGITEQVHFQSWDMIFYLSIRDDRLIVAPNCSLDYPWDAHSFTIANWPLVNELWPPKSSQPSSEPNPQASSESTTKPPRPGSAGFWIDELFPNEAWRPLKPTRIHRTIEQEINKRNAELMQKAQAHNQRVTLLEHVSLSTVRLAVKRRLER